MLGAKKNIGKERKLEKTGHSSKVSVIPAARKGIMMLIVVTKTKIQTKCLRKDEAAGAEVIVINIKLLNYVQE